MDPLKSKVKRVFVQEEKVLNGGGGDMKMAAMEMRPGGMLVQKREDELKQGPVSLPLINVRVKYGSTRKDIRINPQANFGELKKLVAEHTGVHHLDQKLIFKKEEKHSRAFLDESGVKDGSKIVLIEDSKSRDRRCLEMVKVAKMEKAKKFLQQVSAELEITQGKVRAMELAASKKEIVEEVDVDSTIDILMKNLVALNGLFVSGNLKLEKNSQESRVKKLIEALDTLKLKAKRNTNQETKPKLERHCNLMDQMPIPNGMQQAAKVKQVGEKERFPFQQHQQQTGHFKPVVMTTKWVTFE